MIVMTFKPGHPVKIHVEGMTGASCHEATRPYEEAIGGNVLSTQATSEAALPPLTVAEEQNVTGGDV